MSVVKSKLSAFEAWGSVAGSHDQMAIFITADQSKLIFNKHLLEKVFAQAGQHDSEYTDQDKALMKIALEQDPSPKS